MLCGITVAVYCQDHTERTDTVRVSQEAPFVSEHSAAIIPCTAFQPEESSAPCATAEIRTKAQCQGMLNCLSSHGDELSF
jgi:hypothetical protein